MNLSSVCPLSPFCYRRVILKMAFVREGALMSDEMREHVSHLISIVVLAVRGRRSGWMVASVNSSAAAGWLELETVGNPHHPSSCYPICCVLLRSFFDGSCSARRAAIAGDHPPLYNTLQIKIFECRGEMSTECSRSEVLDCKIEIGVYPR